MPYLTVMQPEAYEQMHHDDILYGNVDLSKYLKPHNTTNTRTHFTDNVPEKWLSAFDFDRLTNILIAFNQQHDTLYRQERPSLYRTFYIPKKNSKKKRRIDQPDYQLMAALRQLKDIFEFEFKVLYHTTAFAYVKGRSTVDAMKRHQNNNSLWFAKFDFENFFGNTTPEFLLSMLSMIFPFSEIVKQDKGKEALAKALSLCFLEGGLPQGTPISPLLTNIMMIPIDHAISNKLRKRERRFLYTRYADDLLISCPTQFNCGRMQRFIMDILENYGAPFSINPSKTRYGSNSGQNWNLGIMLNSENKLSAGRDNKKQLKARIHHYLEAKRTGQSWPKHELQSLYGLINYYRMIEKDTINHILDWFSKKYQFSVETCMLNDLKI